jgi:hypothetical protein
MGAHTEPAAICSVDSDRSLEGLVPVVVVTLQTSRTLCLPVDADADADAGTPPVRGSGNVTAVVPAESAGTVAMHYSCSTSTLAMMGADIVLLLFRDFGSRTRPGCPKTGSGYTASAQSTPAAR